MDLPAGLAVGCAGALIVVTVVYFQDGVMGWLTHKKPEWFGIRVERRE